MHRLPPAPGLDLRTERWAQQNVEAAAEPRSTVTHTFQAANTEERIRHRLGATPRGWTVRAKDAACDLYRDGTTHRADRSFLYLKSTLAPVTVTLEIR